MTSAATTPFGLTLLVDKPIGWTSFDVVNKLRYKAKRVTGRKKIKVGHAGTLDPLAGGLVIVCVGSHTKLIDGFIGLPKQYKGTIRLGATTPSYDLETEIDETFSLPLNDPKLLTATAQQFLGEIEQMPPAFSAKKVNGQKAYHLARRGKEVDLKPAEIHITEFDVDASEFPDIHFTLDCSKGTYVRSLAFDYGKALNSGAHLIALKRTRIGEFRIENSYSVESAMEAIETAYLDSKD